MRPLKPKPLLASSTIWGISLSAITVLLSSAMQPTFRLSVNNLCPPAVPAANEVMQESPERVLCKENISDVLGIITALLTALGLGGAGTAVYGRVSVGDLWTPKGMPGPNQTDMNLAFDRQSLLMPSLSSHPNLTPTSLSEDILSMPLEDPEDSASASQSELNLNVTAARALRGNSTESPIQYAIFSNPEEALQ